MKKKASYLPPILVATVLLVYLAVYFLLVFSLPDLPPWLKLLIGLIPLIAGGTLIFVLVQRIRELRSHETDDLDKY